MPIFSTFSRSFYALREPIAQQALVHLDNAIIKGSKFPSKEPDVALRSKSKTLCIVFDYLLPNLPVTPLHVARDEYIQRMWPDTKVSERIGNLQSMYSTAVSNLNVLAALNIKINHYEITSFHFDNTKWRGQKSRFWCLRLRIVWKQKNGRYPNLTTADDYGYVLDKYLPASFYGDDTPETATMRFWQTPEGYLTWRFHNRSRRYPNS